jgi:hypothetical protein
MLSLRLRTHCSKSSNKGMHLKTGFVDIINTTIIAEQMLLWYSNHKEDRLALFLPLFFV